MYFTKALSVALLLTAIVTPARSLANYFDSFESGIGSYWTITKDGPTGTIAVTSLAAHSGIYGLLMDEVAPDDGSQQLRHDSFSGFQGLLSVWVYFPETDNPPSPNTSAHGWFQVVGADGRACDVEFRYADSNGGSTSGQAHGGGYEISVSNVSQFGSGWHQMTAQVDGTGTRTWFDGIPIPDAHPGLTLATGVNFGIGWNWGGAAIFDDFQAIDIPEPSTFILLIVAVLSLFAYVWRRRR
jgi:hypothetical protein